MTFKYNHANCTCPFAVDERDYDWDGHYRRCRELEASGYVQPPDWMPVGMPPYEWEFPGCVHAYMKPRPSLWHRFRFGSWPLRQISLWRHRRAFRKRIRRDVFAAKQRNAPAPTGNSAGGGENAD